MEGAIVKEHYLVPMHYSSSQAIENLLLWIKKQIGADEEVPLQLEVSSLSLDFYPFWHAIVLAETSFSGVGEDATYGSPEGFNTYRSIHRTSKQESGKIDRGLGLTYPASTEIPKQVLNYEFPAKGRKYFSEAYTKEHGGKIHNGVLTQPMVEEIAKTDAAKTIGTLISKEVFQVTSRQDNINILSMFYLHVPLWSINYKHGGKNFQAYVDASTGRVVHATYPISIKHRTFTGTLALAHGAVGLVLFLLLGEAFPLVGLGALGGFVACAVVFAFRAFRLGRGREAAE